MTPPVVRVIVIVDDVAYELLNAAPEVSLAAFGCEPQRHDAAGDPIVPPRNPYLAPYRVEWRNRGAGSVTRVRATVEPWPAGETP